MPRPKESNSLPTLGQASVAVDKLTRERLKKIAGDKPVSAFLRDWSAEVLNGETPLTGAGKMSSPLPATKADIKAAMGDFRAESMKFAKAIIAAFGVSLGALQIPDEVWNGDYSFNEIYDMAEKARKAAKQAEMPIIQNQPENAH